MANVHSYNEEQRLKDMKKVRQICADELPEYCTGFFRSLETRTTPKTLVGYAYDLSVFFRFLKNESKFDLSNDYPTLKEIEDLKLLDFEDYIDYLRYHKFDSYKDQDIDNKSENNKKNINNEKINSETTIKRKLSSIKSFYSYLYKNELIEKDITTKIVMPKLREKTITRLEVDEVVKLLDYVENGDENLSNRQKEFHNKTKLRDSALLSLLLATGMRVSECVGIDINDIDFDECQIRIIRKGQKESFIYFSEEVKDIMLKYLEERKQIITEDNSNAFFLSLQNKRISVRSVEILVKKYASKITPLKHITPHKLRSTYGTNLYKETGDIYLVADVLGHSDVNTTKKHYAAIDIDRKRAARNIVKLRENDNKENNDD